MPYVVLNSMGRRQRCEWAGTEEQLVRMTGRVFSQALDRSKPLWEIWLVAGVSGDRFALLSKTHQIRHKYPLHAALQ